MSAGFVSTYRVASVAKRSVKSLAYRLGLSSGFEELYARYRWWHYRRAGVVFVHVPKAAGTSVAVSLFGRRLGHHTLTSLLAEAVRRESTRLLRVAVVRHPLTRFVSAHRFLSQGGGSDGTVNHLDRYADWMRTDIVRFATEWLPKQDLAICNPIFRPQTAYVSQAQLAARELDVLGRVESLDAFRAELEARGVRFRLPLEHRNASSRGSTGERTLHPEVISAVSEIYRADFEVFGYSHTIEASDA